VGRQIVRHTLRHTAITHLVQAGIDLPTVKRISGHKTLAMVERYAHANGAHIEIAMDKLESRLKIASTTSAADSITRELHKTQDTALAKVAEVVDKIGGPGWTRTSDQRIMSPLL
jgi:hypothetical protein